MHRGRFQLGDEVTLGVLCLDGSGTPHAPDRAPFAKVWTPAGAVAWSGFVPVRDRYGTTGLFQYGLFLTSAFAAGTHRVSYQYSIGTYTGLGEDVFEILAGGDGGGPVVAMTFFHRPQADYVVQQLASGRIVKGRNPRL